MARGHRPAGAAPRAADGAPDGGGRGAGRNQAAEAKPPRRRARALAAGQKGSGSQAAGPSNPRLECATQNAGIPEPIHRSTKGLETRNTTESHTTGGVAWGAAPVPSPEPTRRSRNPPFLEPAYEALRSRGSPPRRARLSATAPRRAPPARPAPLRSTRRRRGRRRWRPAGTLGGTAGPGPAVAGPGCREAEQKRRPPLPAAAVSTLCDSEAAAVAAAAAAAAAAAGGAARRRGSGRIGERRGGGLLHAPEGRELGEVVR